MDRLNAGNRLPDGGRLLVENPQAADLDVPLTNSIIPQRGIGAISYTRATIATVTDNDGIIRNCLSGEARFLGARRVANLATFSEDASNASWTKSRATVTSNSVVDPDGKLVADTIVGDGTGPSYFYKGFSFVSGNKYRASICFKAANVSTVSITSFTQTGTCSFDLAGGTAGTPTGIASAPSIQSLGNGWYRCSVLFTANATASNNVGFVNVNYLGDICYVVRMQMEDVTGQSIQTVGEYVSTSVLTTAPFHGANVDGVKYFNTTLSGATISPSILKGYICEAGKTNLFLQSEDFATSWGVTGGGSVSVNQGIAPDGTMGMDKFIPGVTTIAQYIGQPVTTTANTYTQSVYVKSSGYNYIQMWCSSSISSGYVNFDLSTGTVTASSIWTGVIEALPNGVYRCSAITGNVLAATGSFVIGLIATPTATRASSFGGNGTDGIFLWGAQLELGDFPSSYIPTTTVAVARSIDVLSYNSSNAIDSQGAAYVEASLILPGNTTSSVPSRFLLSRGASGRMFYISSAINTINNYDGTTVLASNLGTSMNGNVVKMASSWSGSTKGIYYGTSVPKTSAFDGTMGTGNIDVGLTWNGTVRNVRVWKTPPTVAELTSITTL